MSNNKQSSVEWLINKCACADLRPELWNIIKEQAKAMHKEEIEKSFDRGRFWNMSWDGESYYEEVIIKGNNE